MAQSPTMHKSTKLENSTYNVINALQKEANFLYSTVDTYIEDVQKDNRSDLVNVWNTMKKDNERHIEMLRQALSKEAKEGKFR
jgi:site-specific DNA-adenine methylase